MCKGIKNHSLARHASIALIQEPFSAEPKINEGGFRPDPAPPNPIVYAFLYTVL